MKTVSIIIPTIGRSYFKYAYISALNQNVNDMEIIVCDYGKNDFPEYLIKKFPDKRVKYYKFEDPGRLEGYRKGIELAEGKFIKLLLDDDMLMPNSVKLMLEVFKNYKDVVLVTSQRYIIDENNKIKGLFNKYLKKNFIWDGIKAGNILLFNFSNFIGEPSTVLFKKEDLDEPYGRLFGVDALCNDDVATWLNLLKKGKLAYISFPLSFFRIHSNQAQNKPHYKAKGFIDWIEHILNGYKLGFLNNDENLFIKTLLKISLSIEKNYEKLLENAEEHDKIRLIERINNVMEILKKEGYVESANF